MSLPLACEIFIFIMLCNLQCVCILKVPCTFSLDLPFFTKFWLPAQACIEIQSFFHLSLVANFVGQIPVYSAIHGS
jgi:hypothetical protein